MTCLKQMEVAACQAERPALMSRAGSGSTELWRSIALLQAALVAMALAGCAAVSSQLAADLKEVAPSGVHYYLPKRVMEFTLAVDQENAKFRVLAGDPETIIDQKHSYYLQIRHLPQYHDHIVVDVGAKGFITGITVNTTDETVNIIKNIAHTAGLFGRGLEANELAANEVVLAQAKIDPANDCEVSKMVDEFNAAVASYARDVRNSALCRPDRDAGIILSVPAHARCEEFRSVAAMAASSAKYVRVNVRRLARDEASEPDGSQSCGKPVIAAKRSRSEKATNQADCTEGMCYRPSEHYQLSLAVGRGLTTSTILMPNRARLVQIDLDRAFLVNKTHTIAFDTTHGSLTSISVTKASEVLALAGLPIAVLNEIADGLQFRATIIQESAANVSSKSELIEQRANLQKQKAMLQAAKVAKQTSATSFSSVPTSSTVSVQPGSIFENLKPLQ